MSSSLHAFRIEGELTIYRAAELAPALKSALDAVPAGEALTVDLGEVGEMDCAGVQLLIAARRSARESGRALRLGERSAAAAEVLRTLALGPLFAE